MLWETISVVRDLHRLHEIASIMIRYGWGDFVRLLGVANALERRAHFTLADHLGDFAA